jgi:calcium channel MID1
VPLPPNILANVEISEDNCKIVYDLPFCDSVAYAVPTNPKNESLTVSELKLTYDNYASALFKNFTNSLDQIQCHTAETAQYSLATNCDICSQNYKLWLCAVTIPRCEDFSNNNNFLQARNIGHAFSNGTVPQFNIPGIQAPQVQAPSRLLYNSSRNPMIDQVIKPGPYKELLPCQELCFDLVQACPTALQFTCPKANGYAGGILSNSYGTYDPAKVSPNDFVTCNFLGVDWPSLSEGRKHRISGMGWTLVVGVMLFLVRE